MSLSITFNYLLFLAILIGSLLLPIHVGSFRFDSHVIYGFYFDRLLISNLFGVFLDYLINFLTLIIWHKPGDESVVFAFLTFVICLGPGGESQICFSDFRHLAQAT